VQREVWVACPTCHADGRVYIHPKLGTLSIAAAQEKGFAVREESKEAACPTCPKVRRSRQGRTYYSADEGGLWTIASDRHHGAGYMDGYRWLNGLVLKTVTVEREVGVVQWAAGTKFDSRFGGGYHCSLCSKAIPSGRFVPVTGRGADGVVHGMWVGEDCAKKFFGVKNFKKDQVVERPTEAK
jgi:hypothetical protein